jgi:hypothetical protein
MTSSTPPPYPDDSTYGYGPGRPTPPSDYGTFQGGSTEPTRSQAKGFFNALFDLSFNNFVTLAFAKLIYVIALIIIAIIWLVAVIAAFSEGIGQGLLAVVLGSIVALFYVVLVRVGLEFSVAMVRTAQNTSDLVARRA